MRSKLHVLHFRYVPDSGWWCVEEWVCKTDQTSLMGSKLRVLSLPLQDVVHSTRVSQFRKWTLPHYTTYNNEGYFVKSSWQTTQTAPHSQSCLLATEYDLILPSQPHAITDTHSALNSSHRVLMDFLAACNGSRSTIHKCLPYCVGTIYLEPKPPKLYMYSTCTSK